MKSALINGRVFDGEVLHEGMLMLAGILKGVSLHRAW